MSDTLPERVTLLSYYEEMRQYILAGSSGIYRHHGLALFLQQGMAAWLKACTDVASVAQSLSKTRAPTQLVSWDIRAEATRILATMALHSYRGVA